MATKAVLAHDFLVMLRDAGIIPGDTSRVVIDAKAGEVLLMYYEVCGTGDLIKVITPESLGHAVKIEVSESATVDLQPEHGN